MNSKFLIPTIAMAFATIAVTTVPAQAQLAFGNGGFTNGLGGVPGAWPHHHHHHNLMNGAAYNNGYGASPYTNGVVGTSYTPYAGGLMGSPYSSPIAGGMMGAPYSSPIAGGMMGAPYSPYGNGYGNGGFLSRLFGSNGTPTAALTNRLSQRQSFLQNLLSSGSLTGNRQAWAQNQLNQVNGAQSSIANGTFNPSSLGAGGMRRLLGF